jgi:hypothetical protein
MISSRSDDDALLEFVGLSGAATASSACAGCAMPVPNSADAMAARSKELCLTGIPNVSPPPSGRAVHWRGRYLTSIPVSQSSIGG